MGIIANFGIQCWPSTISSAVFFGIEGPSHIALLIVHTYAICNRNIYIALFLAILELGTFIPNAVRHFTWLCVGKALKLPLSDDSNITRLCHGVPRSST